jgi:tetratricopeptide (TPR) repeat protein
MTQQELTMDHHAESLKAQQEYQRGLQELEAGNVLAALARLEAALKLWDNPDWHPCLGYCIAKERGHVTKGLELCQAAVERQPDWPEHYYYLARVLLVAKRKPEAIQALRQGLSHGEHHLIKRLLDELGSRRAPVFPWLHRDNPCNKYLGMLLSRIGLR